MKLDFCDFFSGCGGTSRGVLDAGINVRFGLDSDPDAKLTFEANFPKAKFVGRDIRSLAATDLEPYLRRKYGRPLFFGVCAPCQPFSKQNRAKQGDDRRTSLLGELHRFVRMHFPEYIFVENVPGLQTVGGSEGPLAEFVRLLESLNYHYDCQIVMACHYGVPQRRRRLVLLASRLGPIGIPPCTSGPGTDHPDLPSVWEHISQLPEICAGETHGEVDGHRAAHLSPQNLKRIESTPVGGDRRDWPDELCLPCHREHPGHTDVYGRMLKDQPSAALTTRCISLSNGRFGHPVQNRAISVREAACIQTFPMDFTFRGTLNSMARQVGNAVPVAMAKVFGDHVVRHFASHRRRLAA